MFFLYLLGFQTSVQFDFLSVLVVFLFLNCCCPFGCVRRHSVSTYASIWPEAEILKILILKLGAVYMVLRPYWNPEIWYPESFVF